MINSASLKTKLFVAVRVFVLAAFLFSAIGYSYASGGCDERPVVLKELFQNGYAYIGTFTADTGHVTQLYLNLKTGAWKWIGVTPDIKFCILMQGKETALAVEREG